MDEDKYQLLFRVFWDMNEIGTRTESYTETVTETATDADGNKVETEVTVQRTRLVITVTGKTASETAELYGFDEQQRQQLEELLSKEYDELWRAVIYGVSASDDIVELALSQVGNNGEIYWTYMGCNSGDRVSSNAWSVEYYEIIGFGKGLICIPANPILPTLEPSYS